MSFAVLVLKVLLTYFALVLLPNDLRHVAEKPKARDIKALYVTAYTAANDQKIGALIGIAKKTEINALVIDVKDYSGSVFVPMRSSSGIEARIGSVKILNSEIRKLIQEINEQGIYTIARITVFQDPILAQNSPEYAVRNSRGEIWRDFKGISWVDPSRREVWAYNVEVAKAAVMLGFKEVNFDYVRFPSDGPINEMSFEFEGRGVKKTDIMADFFEFINSQFKFIPVNTSADVFGMTLWRSDGLGIGQRVEDAIENFDYVYPMVYPSHYPSGFEGFVNPSEHPYEIVYKSLDKFRKNTSMNLTQVKPWIQDFDLGSEYGSDKIQLQMKAAYDAGAKGWLMWNASNRYSVEALKDEDKSLPAIE